MADSVSLSPESPPGLFSEEALRLLKTIGPNAVSLPHPSRLLLLLKKFWGPVPWMLEAAFILAVLLGKNLEALIILVLLLLNDNLAFTMEQKGQKALELLQSHLEIRSMVMRDDIWQMTSARNLVPGDMVHVHAGDFVPADLTLISGRPLLDQSSLTGESLPTEKIRERLSGPDRSSGGERETEL